MKKRLTIQLNIKTKYHPNLNTFHMRFIKFFSLVLFLSLICGSCKKSPTYVGNYSDEPIKETAYKVELLSVELLSFSFPISAYSSNDAGNGPDVYFSLYTDGSTSNKKYTYNQVYNNMLPSNLPYKFVFVQPILIESYETVKLTSVPKSFNDLLVFGFGSQAGKIFMFDYDGPSVFSPLTIYNQSLTSFDMHDFIFKPGINKVLTVSGDAIIEYKITKI
jgi:hypothetical protein